DWCDASQDVITKFARHPSTAFAQGSYQSSRCPYPPPPVQVLPIGFFAGFRNAIKHSQNEAANGIDVDGSGDIFDVEVENEFRERILAVDQPCAIGTLDDGILFRMEVGYISHQRLQYIVHGDHSQQQPVFVCDQGIVHFRSLESVQRDVCRSGLHEKMGGFDYALQVTALGYDVAEQVRKRNHTNDVVLVSIIYRINTMQLLAYGLADGVVVV